MSDRILKYLPDILQTVEDYKQIANTESVEFDNMESAIQQVFDNQFVMTSDEEAVVRREKMLGIQADPDTESLEFRKKRIMNRYQTKPPFTIRYLQQQLDRLVGEGMTIVSVDVQNFILYVTANIDNANIFREVIHTVETIKPANLEYQQNTSLEDVLGLEHHISKQDITWNYALGEWKLGEKPFSTLGSKEVII